MKSNLRMCGWPIAYSHLALQLRRGFNFSVTERYWYLLVKTAAELTSRIRRAYLFTRFSHDEATMVYAFMGIQTRCVTTLKHGGRHTSKVYTMIIGVWSKLDLYYSTCKSCSLCSISPRDIKNPTDVDVHNNDRYIPQYIRSPVRSLQFGVVFALSVLRD